MFERYTEKARRVIFFARYEASQFAGTEYVESEHLLLGLLRDDKTLAKRLEPAPGAVEAIRRQIEAIGREGEKVPTSVELPLSEEFQRILLYAAEEAEQLGDKHIGTEHLLLGLLREQDCFAAQLLRNRGVVLPKVRIRVQTKIQPPAPPPPLQQRRPDMFERYTEKARRVIFFGRYEAGTLGSPSIETEHLLLGLLREDKALAEQFKLPAEALREQIDKLATRQAMVEPAVDMPLSQESQRVLAFAAEEAERMNTRNLDTPHLLLGLLREERSLAAVLLNERGLHLSQAREALARTMSAPPNAAPAVTFEPKWATRLRRILLDRQKSGGVTIAAWPTVASDTPDFALYAGEAVETDGQILEEVDPQLPLTPRGEIEMLRRRLRMIVSQMEKAIANHEFENARLLSDEERKERENLRQKREQYKFQEQEHKPPFLCIEFARNESMAVLNKRIDGYLAAGTGQVWLLDPASRKAYTATPSEGLREVKGLVLELNGLSLPLHELFS